MRKALAVFAFLLLSIPAHAQLIPGAGNFGQTCTGGGIFCSPVPYTPKRYYNFMTGSLPSAVTFSRASAANYFNSSGNLVSASTNTPRFDYGVPGSSTLYGLLLEPAATNLLLNSRDLTQSSWTATSVTVAKDQTGIDAVSNSASSLTSTGANGTVCQPLTLASTCYFETVYLKRLSGSGTISLSLDNGSTYSNVTITSSWARYTHAEQIIANPGMCIKIVTSGDSIAVDATQIENTLGSGHCYGTSPILTTGTTASRSADVATISPFTGYNVGSGAAMLNFRQNSLGQAAATFAQLLPNGLSFGANNGNTITTGSNCLTPSTSAVNKVAQNYTTKIFGGANTGTACSLSITQRVNSTSLNLAAGGAYWLQAFTYWNYSLDPNGLKAQTQ